MSRLVFLVVAACWSGYGPGPKPGKWTSCGPQCVQPIEPREPDCVARGTLEFATWLAPTLGSRVAGGNAPAFGLSAGAESTFPLALDEDLRVGPWLEVGGDSLDLVRARGGVTVLLGDVHDPRFVPDLAATHSEGAVGVRLGVGWRAVGALDGASDGAQLSARVTYGSRRYMETYEGNNYYGVCDGSEHAMRDGRRYDLGHYGPSFAYGHRLFVEVERALDAPATQLIVGVEIDPATILDTLRELRTIPL